MTSWSKPELEGHIPGLGPTDKPLRIASRPCACGTDIVVDLDNPAPQVLRHNRTRGHVLWWVRREADWQGDE